MVKFRQVTQNDRSLGLDIRKGQYKSGVNPAKMLEDAFSEDIGNDTHVFVICDDELPVGLIEYCIEEKLHCYNLLYLFIDQRYQGKGYGYEAVRLLIVKLKDDGKFDKVAVTLNNSNGTARKLYEKIGFHPNGFVFEDEYDMEICLR